MKRFLKETNGECTMVVTYTLLAVIVAIIIAVFVFYGWIPGLLTLPR